MLSLGMILSQFSQLGLGAVIIKFLPYFKYEKQSFRAFQRHVAKILSTGIIIVSLLLYLFDDYIIRLYTENADLLTEYFYLLFPLMMFMAMYEVVDAYMRAYFKTVFSTFIRDVLIRLITAVLIFMYYLRWFSFSMFVYLFSGIYLIAFLILLTRFLLIKKNFKESLQSYTQIPKRMISYMHRYGIYAVLTSASGMLINNIDVIMLGFLAGLEEVAVYSVAFYISVAIQIPQRSLARIITPVLSVSWKQRDFANIFSLYQKSSAVLFFTGTFIFSIIWVNIDDLFAIMPKAAIYQKGKWVMFLVGISKLIDMITGINTDIIAVSRYYSFNFYSLLFLVFVAVISNFIFIPVYGVNGAAIATLISVALFNFIKLIFIQYKMKMQPFTKQTLIILVLFILCNLIIGNIHFVKDSFILSMLIKTLLVITVFVCIAYLIDLRKLTGIAQK
jgi:O-antigen/teichoic acid export membrane protein